MLGFFTPIAAQAATPGELMVKDKTVYENVGNASVRIALAHRVTHKVSVGYKTVNGTAIAGTDYTAVSGRVVFPKGAKVRHVSVPILNDTAVESTESFKVRLFDPFKARILDRTGIVTILDDDKAPPVVLPAMSVKDATAQEGDALKFAVTLDKAPAAAVTFDYATSDGTAKAPGDYTAVTNGKGTIAAGSTSTEISIATTEDSTPESTEAMTLTLSNAVGATIADGSATGTITDDDAQPSISVADSSAVEGKDVTFTVTLSAVSALEVKAEWATSNGTAVAPGDYTAASGVVTIPAGSKTGTFSVKTVDDSVDEANETFNVTLSSPHNATIADGTAVGTIIDNDGPSISVADSTATEGSPVVFTVKLSAASPQDVSVKYATKDDTATAPADYTAASGTLTIKAGATSGTVSVATVDDKIVEPTEHFEFNLSDAVNGVISHGHADGIIKDNDVALPTLSVSDAHATEGSPVVFTVTLSAKSSVPVTFGWKTSDNAPGDTAATPADYVAEHDSNVVIPAGQLTATFDVATVNDTKAEADEIFHVTLYGPINATIADGTGVGMIVDNDAPSVAIAGSTEVKEGNHAVLKVTLSAPSEETITVKFSTVNDSATSAHDFKAVTDATLTFAPGVTQQDAAVETLTGDGTEPDEWFFMKLTSATNATLNPAHLQGEVKILANTT